ncbi:1-deoxy-D-xylulose-5-phosphate reductoisomerase [Candidatus Contubernalis alkaliaceticus]|uniref:1-deoxy-D-xylulose-5-phosphate reductoisomerase n=1 Tax=Candidatus Contubernalis alkaliaceticus TaxID=338645 RepID=UPI001F4C0856|nr:1-deoxy-D-xylulose-5-phosphate reductoisomerase [Candidatus Contubernalis alkalaceticus]UNC91831.1 1-deoxy-D-xylulose-5-phosphate reductoisomerase [Candidatus Contubernalis alkalaceticus]
MDLRRQYKRKNLILLGSTGSIGTQTLSMVERWPDRFKITALAAGSNGNLLEEQARKFKPHYVSLAQEKGARELRAKLRDTDIKVLYGHQGLLEIVSSPDADWVVNALVGFDGLAPTVTAMEEGKNIALANKETLVAGGELIMNLAEKKGVSIVPIDSEHSAIFQCLQGEKREEVSKILLTASGGPFRGCTLEELSKVTLAQALLHPNWVMGRKITIDSATLMNKGLEVLEAQVLFNLDLEQIQVLVHPQSIIHSMVEFVDGSVKAQLGVPDMGVPIQYALTYPERWANSMERIDWRKMDKMTFEMPDKKAFPCLGLAFEAGKIGGTMPAVMNAANEAAVNFFLEGRITFLDIPRIIEETMHKHKVILSPSLSDIIRVDKEVREQIIRSK